MLCFSQWVFWIHIFCKNTTHWVCVYVTWQVQMCCFFAFYTLLIIFAVFKMCKEKREPNQTFKTNSNVRKLMPLGEERECTTSHLSGKNEKIIGFTSNYYLADWRGTPNWLFLKVTSFDNFQLQIFILVFKLHFKVILICCILGLCAAP